MGDWLANIYDIYLHIYICCCGLRIFRFLEFGFRFSGKMLIGFRIFIFDLFGFRFLFDLSGNYAPPLISNSS